MPPPRAGQRRRPTPTPRAVGGWRRPAVAAGVALLVALVGAASCSSDDDGDGDQVIASAPSVPGASRSSFASVADLADALGAAGLPCDLEYEGLTDGSKELSLCTLEGEQATLSIWSEPDQLDAFLASPAGGPGATAVGANWTVDVTSEELAGQVAVAVGGVVHT